MLMLILDWKKMIVFEVFKDSKRVFYTKHSEYVPNEELIKLMKKAGYKVKVKLKDKIISRR